MLCNAKPYEYVCVSFYKKKKKLPFWDQNIFIIIWCCSFEKRVKCSSIAFVDSEDSEDDLHVEDKSHKCKTTLQRGGLSAATLKVLASMQSHAAGEDSKSGNMSVLN